jgi:preprotein translocase subunit SecA
MAGRGVDIKLGGNPSTPEAYQAVKDLGGLFVLGTERHEARRIDNQLRGRSGRQGDPGETQFFVSLEDSLMRVFAADTIKRMMGRFRIPEDQPIENGLISRSLESAQTKIEGFNFDARKHVLAYDDVLNRQRQAVYERRRKILLGDAQELDALVLEMLGDGDDPRTILENKKRELGEETFYTSLRRIALQAIDTLWVEHLELMEYTRSSVNLRAYGQRDPLIEYRKEGLRLFHEMQNGVAEMIRKVLPNLGAPPPVTQDRHLEAVHQRYSALGGPRPAPGSSSAPVSGSRKYGRNEIVTVTDGTQQKQMKYKKAEPLLKSGEWRLV